MGLQAALAQAQRKPQDESFGDTGALMATAEKVEPLPLSVTRLAGLVGDPDSNIRDIVEVITYDQSLAANLLRQVNSAAFGGRVQIRTVHDAVMRLGTGTVFALALSVSVKGAMSVAIPEYGMAEGQLWSHSVAASLASELVASRTPMSVPMEAPTAALLHDFGKQVLARHFGPGMMAACAQAAVNDQLSLAEAEMKVFGFDHAKVGALVAERWNLSMSIVDAVRDHHSDPADLSPISRTVLLANLLADDLGADPEARDARWVAEREQATNALGIEPATYPQLLDELGTMFRDLAGRYGVERPVAAPEAAAEDQSG